MVHDNCGEEMESSDKLASHLAGTMAPYPAIAGGSMKVQPLLATDAVISAVRSIVAHAQEQTEALLKLMGPFPRDEVSRTVIRIGMTTIRADADRKLAEALDRIEMGARRG